MQASIGRIERGPRRLTPKFRMLNAGINAFSTLKTLTVLLALAYCAAASVWARSSHSAMRCSSSDFVR